MSKKSVRKQIFHAVKSSNKFGDKRRADKFNPVADTRLYNYSIKESQQMLSMAKSFSDWLKINYPDVNYVYKIKKNHFNEYLALREKNWSKKTYETNIDRFIKIQGQINHRYKLELDFTDDAKEDIKRIRRIQKNRKTRAYSDKKRIYRMNELHYEKLLKSVMENSNTGKAMNISRRLGLRVNEISELEIGDFDLKNCVVNITRGAKNNKARKVKIREKDMPYFTDLLEEYGEIIKSRKDNNIRICPIKPDSINRTIRRNMIELGIDDVYKDTTIHTIRKLYCYDRMVEIRGEEKAEEEKEMQCWEIVQKEIGHGDMAREELYNAYVEAICPE